MPEISETMNGVGYCFVSRCLELAQIMVAVYEHDKEQLGARAPRGLLLLTGITQQQWENAMRARKAQLDGEGWQYYNAVAVLASMNTSLEAKLTALSSLPQSFDLQTFVSMLMYGYALCAGYDPSEFYPVQFGSLGRGIEMEVQHEKATGKGGKNFALALQEQLQRMDVLPGTLDFEFDERDDSGEQAAAAVQKAWVEVYKTMRETGLTVDGMGLISRQEARYLLAEKQIVPEDWAGQETEVIATDEQDADTTAEEEASDMTPEVLTEQARRRLRDDLLSRQRVYLAAERFQNEPIIRYRWRGNRGKTIVLWSSGQELLAPKVFAAGVKRAVAKPLYSSAAVEITEDDVDHAIEDARKRVGDEFAQILENEPYAETR
jgi:hypothetical protein